MADTLETVLDEIKTQTPKAANSGPAPGTGSKMYLFNRTQNSCRVEVTKEDPYDIKGEHTTKTQYAVNKGEEVYIGCSIDGVSCNRLNYSWRIL